MCFHSPYAEFWHLYTFFKLLSISREINFSLCVLRTVELVHGCRRELPFLLPSRGARAAGVQEMQACWSRCP